MVCNRDWREMIHYGVIFFMLEKLRAGASERRTCTSMRQCTGSL
jgi:hypothetical protein